MILGLSLGRRALAVGLILALSSTAIVLQTLSEKGLMQTAGGRSAFSVLLTQDIAVIPMLALLPLLARSASPCSGSTASIQRVLSDERRGHGERTCATMSLVDGLPGWGVTLVTLGAVAAIILGGVYGARPLFRFIQRAHVCARCTPPWRC